MVACNEDDGDSELDAMVGCEWRGSLNCRAHEPRLLRLLGGRARLPLDIHHRSVVAEETRNDDEDVSYEQSHREGEFGRALLRNYILIEIIDAVA